LEEQRWKSAHTTEKRRSQYGNGDRDTGGGATRNENLLAAMETHHHHIQNTMTKKKRLGAVGVKNKRRDSQREILGSQLAGGKYQQRIKKSYQRNLSREFFEVWGRRGQGGIQGENKAYSTRRRGRTPPDKDTGQ